MKWSELIKIAVSKGYYLKEHRKKHDLYMNSEGKFFMAERHGSQEIRPGLMNSLKKKINF